MSGDSDYLYNAKLVVFTGNRLLSGAGNIACLELFTPVVGPLQLLCLKAEDSS